jgi:hypothetical protein
MNNTRYPGVSDRRGAEESQPKAPASPTGTRH